MKILFVAPGISTPYSEGRKRFVLDLIDTLSTSEEVYLLTTCHKGESVKVNCEFSSMVLGHGAFHLIYQILALPRIIKEFQPDIICVFPHGTFRHLYGLASKAFMYLTDKICQLMNVPCVTILYSIEGYDSVKSLDKLVSNLALSKRPDWDGLTVNMGLRTADWPERARPEFSQDDDTSTLLFMAGMSGQSNERVDHILNVRGLKVVLESGEYLYKHNVRLIIAAPLFASDECSNYLLSHPSNTWPKEGIELRSFVSVPQIFWDADMFVFPYAQPINHFIPTSILESMFAGTPVAIGDQTFLDELYNEGRTAIRVDTKDAAEFSRAILDGLKDQERLIEKVNNAKEYAHINWSIESSADQIRQCCNSFMKEDKSAFNKNQELSDRE